MHIKDDPWGWNERIIAAVILALVLVTVWGCVRANAAPLAAPDAGSCFAATGRARLGAVVCAPLLGCKGGLTVTVYGKWYTTTVGVPRGLKTGDVVNFVGRVCGESFTARIVG